MLNKKFAFSLAEIMAAMFVLSVLASLTIPSVMTSTAEKTYMTAYKKAVETTTSLVDKYLAIDTNYFESTQESAVQFIKYFIEHTNVKELYSDGDVSNKSETYSALEFKGKVIAGAQNPVSVSPVITITNKPSFWVVTEDNLAYSLVLTDYAKCNEVLNVNTAKTLDKTLIYSCMAIVVDTNGLSKNPNTIEDTQDISDEEYMPNLKNDRYYIFIGSNGATTGNPKHILTGKMYAVK